MQWDEFVDQHGPMVYRTALRIVGQAADAEDVLQDVFLEIHRLWVHRSVAQWSGLLQTLATRRALDRVRQRKDYEPLTSQVASNIRENPEQVAEANELHELVRRAIARLPQQQATAFALHYLENQSHSEIAESLGITNRAVASALHKARHRLESQLEKTIVMKR